MRPSSRALYTVTAATGVCHELGWNKSCVDVQGRLCTVLFHGQTPVAAVTVYSAPDDGRKGHPKHVEHTCSC